MGARVQRLVPQRPRLGLDEGLEHGAVRVAVLPQALPQADAALQPAGVQVGLLDQVAQRREQVDEQLGGRKNKVSVTRRAPAAALLLGMALTVTVGMENR